MSSFRQINVFQHLIHVVMSFILKGLERHTQRVSFILLFIYLVSFYSATHNTSDIVAQKLYSRRNVEKSLVLASFSPPNFN